VRLPNIKEMKNKLLILAISAIVIIASVSCKTHHQPDAEALIGRQLVIEQFGNEVWESASNDNTFIARCPDGSVWMVLVSRPETTEWRGPELETRITGKTMIFPGTVHLPNTDKQF
jgi:hypothetical protein